MDTEEFKWNIFRLIDTRFENSGQADAWMVAEYGTKDINRIDLEKMRRKLMSMQTYLRRQRVPKALVTRTRKMKKSMSDENKKDKPPEAVV